jgi:hypothetical protein
VRRGLSCRGLKPRLRGFKYAFAHFGKGGSAAKDYRREAAQTGADAGRLESS